ncbi:MAG: sigma-54-dependent Fis family transcriptional regulator [Geobacter sp.]|nr:sigma-54-dependent Fis family transcriptional regulator [Geobacter sp.]
MSQSFGSNLPAILLVDDEPEILFSSTVILRKAGFGNIQSMGDSRELLPFLAGHESGVIVLDLQMPHISGKELLGDLATNYPHVPVVIVTAANELETAVECMKAGAFDYLVKPIDTGRFVTVVRNALEMNAMKREISSLRETLLTGQVRNEDAFAPIVTRSQRMKAIFAYLEAIAATEQPVLITGETGVGKDLFARALHKLSGRSGRFIAINSGGLDDQMFSDTLFGHKKGAFTGAGEGREGMIARAADGTLFLDEIGDMNAASQVKLLRLMQDGEYYPLGSDMPLVSRARFVVATNQNLDRLMGEGSFRKDLYYRLRAHHVHIPSLSERPEDIPLLLEAFLDEAAGSMGKQKPAYPPELIAYLSTYHFPGNVRELKALVLDAMARHKGGVLSMAAFREAIGRDMVPPGKASPYPEETCHWLNLTGRFPTIKELEHCLIDKALQSAGGNQGAAAALLGISRQALNKRLSRK